jgi:hypothetical protein
MLVFFLHWPTNCGHRYAAVEEDCNTALALEDDYVKAFLRRGVARRHLGKLTQAVHGDLYMVNIQWNL